MPNTKPNTESGKPDAAETPPILVEATPIPARRRDKQDSAAISVREDLQEESLIAALRKGILGEVLRDYTDDDGNYKPALYKKLARDIRENDETGNGLKLLEMILKERKVAHIHIYGDTTGQRFTNAVLPHSPDEWAADPETGIAIHLPSLKWAERKKAGVKKFSSACVNGCGLLTPQEAAAGDDEVE